MTTQTTSRDILRRFIGFAALTLIGSGTLSAGQHVPRVIFNDDAQMLMETPRSGAFSFVKAWLDREIAAVPFSTYVFLAATPDICTFNSIHGKVYGDRHQWRPNRPESSGQLAK